MRRAFHYPIPRVLLFDYGSKIGRHRFSEEVVVVKIQQLMVSAQTTLLNQDIQVVKDITLKEGLGRHVILENQHQLRSSSLLIAIVTFLTRLQFLANFIFLFTNSPCQTPPKHIWLWQTVDSELGSTKRAARKAMVSASLPPLVLWHISLIMSVSLSRSVNKRKYGVTRIQQIDVKVCFVPLSVVRSLQMWW